ncbi:MAG TPA: class I SAM-dependent methyltransferase [Rhizomicrobium sp.]|nr:class I SAM-dependent methyltransferase [Rhizomicrobium sp.]
MSLPWYLKILSKIALSRLPIPYGVWRRLNLFRAGAMDYLETALAVYRMHSAAAGFAERRGYTVLELGPGDSMLTALFARACGAARSILVDQSPLATDALNVFSAAEALLAREGLPVSGVAQLKTVPEVLRRLNCAYLVDGLQSLKSLPDASVDFVFSNAVIEHVRKSIFAETARELYRIMAPNGVASHWIDYRDHLTEGLNNLRFSEKVWESDFMAQSGFYTNRLNAAEIRALFEQAGFDVEERDTVVWPNGLPTSQAAMHEPFSSALAQELMIMTNWLVLRRKDSVDQVLSGNG